MGRSTKAEVMRRVADIFPLVCDCMSLREIRAFTLSRTDWGTSVSEAQLKRYCATARQQLEEAARYERKRELGAAKQRLERVIARASAKGQLRTVLAAQKQLTDLLGLAAPERMELNGGWDWDNTEAVAALAERFDEIILRAGENTDAERAEAAARAAAETENANHVNKESG